MKKNDLRKTDFLFINHPQITKRATCGGLKRNLSGSNQSGAFLSKQCCIENCNRKHYAKGYCKKHYAYYIGVPRKYGHRHKCKIEDCKIRTINTYCSPHRYRIKHHFPLDLSINCRTLRMNGKNNPNWKGGVAEYPNHYLMKKNRLIILLHYPKCEICGKSATEVHHKNGNKSDHRLSNLMASCHKCNSQLRTRPNIKFLATYGITKEKIAKRLKINYSQCIKLHLQNKLENKLEFFKKEALPSIFNGGER